MIDVIVTVALTARKNENLGWEDVYVETRALRLEFNTEDDMLDWLGEAQRFATSVEKLVAQ